MTHLARTPAHIGHALRRVRKKSRLTQGELASKSGVWQETISKIENGSPGTRLATVFDLCAALDLELVVRVRSKGSTDFLDD